MKQRNSETLLSCAYVKAVSATSPAINSKQPSRPAAEACDNFAGSIPTNDASLVKPQRPPTVVNIELANLENVSNPTALLLDPGA